MLPIIAKQQPIKFGGRIKKNMSCYENYVQARRQVNELLAVHSVLEEKMKENVARIEQNGSSSGMGDVEIQVLSLRGHAPASSDALDVCLEPEDCCSLSEEENKISLNDELPGTVMFSGVSSMDAVVVLSLGNALNKVIEVADLVKNNGFDEWVLFNKELEDSDAVVHEMVDTVSNDESTEKAGIHVQVKLNESEVYKWAKNVQALQAQLKEIDGVMGQAQAQLKSARLAYEQEEKGTRGIPSGKQRRQILEQSVGGNSYYGKWTKKVQSVCTPQRMAVAKNTAIFVASVLCFHFGGDNFAV